MPCPRSTPRRRDDESHEKERVDVEPKTLRIYLKVTDCFAFELVDTAGKTIAEQDDGYVPGFVPGDYGDYVDLKIDVTTGQIMNWPEPELFTEQLQSFLDAQEGEE